MQASLQSLGALSNETSAYMQADEALRMYELEVMEQERLAVEEELRCSRSRVEQGHLDNARRLWLTFVEHNSREVMEKVEQLKAVAGLAALVAGFALISFLQFEYTYNASNRWFNRTVQSLYAFTLALSVALEMSSVVLCSLMLASIVRTGKGYVNAQEEAEFMARARVFALNQRLGDHPPGVTRTFSAHWARRCERDWRLAFRLFYAGTTTFFINMMLAGWIKFSTSLAPAILVAVIMVLSLAHSLFMYTSWSSHLLQCDERGQEPGHRLALSPTGLPFDWHLPPLPPRTISGWAHPTGPITCITTADAAVVAATLTTVLLQPRSPHYTFRLQWQGLQHSMMSAVTPRYPLSYSATAAAALYGTVSSPPAKP